MFQDAVILRRLRAHIPLWAFLSAILFSTGGCKTETDIPFSQGIHIYDKAQRVKIDVPPGATHLYLTTDNKAPTPSASCSVKVGEVIKVARPAALRLDYELDGIAYRQQGIYIIESAIEPARFANRVAIDIFETFIRNHVNPAFGNYTPSTDETKSITDGMGGTITRITDINGIFNITGRQTFIFDDYKYSDAGSDTHLIVKSGRIFGFRDEDGGYYNSDAEGETLVFAGTFNGNADGNFGLSSSGQTSSGFYRVQCRDRWCADGDVLYALNSMLEFVEIYPSTSAEVRSCQ